MNLVFWACKVVLLGGTLILPQIAHSQPIQAELLYSFPYGPREVETRVVQGPDGLLYGTSSEGGATGYGTVYQVRTNGAWSLLLSFGGTNGMYPMGSLTVAPDRYLYGTTQKGGDSNYGTIYRLSTSGGLATVFSFTNTNADGAYPIGDLTLGSDGRFYGTTSGGGSNGFGTVFAVTTNGLLTTLASFPDGTWSSINPVLAQANDGNFYGLSVNNDWTSQATFSVFRVTPSGDLTRLSSYSLEQFGHPLGGLTLGPDGELYGTADALDNGLISQVFQVTTNGDLQPLVSLGSVNNYWDIRSGLTLGPDGNFYGAGSGLAYRVTTNGVLTVLALFLDDLHGGQTFARLTVGNDGNLYGTADNFLSELPSSFVCSSVFELRTNGGFAVLASMFFPNGAFPGPITHGSDGSFYGTTENGGPDNAGTIFRWTTLDPPITVASFDGTNEGNLPEGSLTLGPDGALYGTATYGGSNYDGTVFRFATNGTLTAIATFGGTIESGSDPTGAMLLGPDGALYGTTTWGGGNTDSGLNPSGCGTVFRVTTAGQLSTLASFGGTNGESPNPGLALGPDGKLYGTTSAGGIDNTYGTVFSVTTNGLLTTLAFFNGTNGSRPRAGLTLGTDGCLYGTTGRGGPSDAGSLFRVDTNGTFTTVLWFNETNGYGTDSPLLPGAGGSFYGRNGSSAVYQVTTNGILTVLTYDGSYFGWITLDADGDLYDVTDGGEDTIGSIHRLRHGAYVRSFGMATNGFALNVLNIGGSNNVIIESSPDLITWTPILTNGTDAAQQFIDSAALARSQQFYRVIQH